MSLSILLKSNIMDIKVSIGIPTYNRSELVLRCVLSCISQNYENIEIIISDNCSSDDTVRKLKSIVDPRLIINENKHNLGMKANFQKCLDLATGDLFILLSDDDYFINESVVENFISEYRRTRKGVVISSVMLERGRDINPGKFEKTFGDSDFLLKYFSNKISIYPCATMYERRLISNETYIDEKMELAVDAFMILKAIEKFEGDAVHFFDGKLVVYKVHDSESSSNYKIWENDLDCLAEKIDKLSTLDKEKILIAISDSRNRAIIGYLSRKIRKNGITYDILLEILINIKKILRVSNLKFIAGRIKS